MFKKLIRRVLSLMLTVTLALAFSTVAFADGTGKETQAMVLGINNTIDSTEFISNINLKQSGTVFAIKNNGELWAVTDGKSAKILDDCVNVSADISFAYAVKTDGTVWQIDTHNSNAVKQILADIPDISFTYADWGGPNQILAVTSSGTLFRYEWDNSTTAEVTSAVKSIFGAYGAFYALKNDGTLWLITSKDSASVPILEQVTDGAQTMIERLFTNRAETIRSKGNEMGNTAYYIDENNVLQFDGQYIDETSGEFFGFDRIEIATDVAAFVVTDKLTVLKRDGTLWGNAYIEWGELYDGELQELLTDVRLPGVFSQDGSPSLPETNQNVPSVWAVESIETAKSLGLATADLTNGYQVATTRAEFCRAAVNFLRQYGYDVDSVTAKTFADTSDKDIGIAAALGITSGTDVAKNLFSPDNQLTREQAATMLCNVLKVLGVNYGNASVAWTDKTVVSAWAAEGIDVMYNAKIMGGTSATELVFSPKSPYTHEHSIITFVNLWNYVKQ